MPQSAETSAARGVVLDHRRPLTGDRKNAYEDTGLRAARVVEREVHEAAGREGRVGVQIQVRGRANGVGESDRAHAASVRTAGVADDDRDLVHGALVGSGLREKAAAR